MAHTVFRNASGLPDPEQVTTARDMATLARRLVADFPDDYRYFSTPSFRFRNREIANHDHLLESYPGADGIKTGFITASGYNLVTSAMRSNIRLIGVVLGAARATERDSQMKSLLDEGFAQLDVAPVIAAPRHEPGGRFPLTQQSVPPRGAPQPVLPIPPLPIPPIASQPRPGLTRWSVQVGSFQQEGAARDAANAARRVAEVGQPHVEPATTKGRTTWRAQLVGLSAAEASGTCAALARHRTACIVLKPEAGQVARN
jgi:D-alanyl-D-alanine carboxypeptidase